MSFVGSLVMAYIAMACIAMAYIGMAYAVMAYIAAGASAGCRWLYSYGLHSHVMYSYGLYTRWSQRWMTSAP